MTPDREAQVRRAREVLDGAGWLFDEFVNAETRRMVMSNPGDHAIREEAYRRARVAMEMKASLEAVLVNAHADDEAAKHREHRQQTNKERAEAGWAAFKARQGLPADMPMPLETRQ